MVVVIAAAVAFIFAHFLEGEPKSYVEFNSGSISLAFSCCCYKITRTLPTKLPVVVITAAAAALIFAHFKEGEPKSYVEFKAGLYPWAELLLQDFHLHYQLNHL